MFEKFVKRENEIFDILQAFIDEKLDFVLIGGYAVSAFKHRFSVDADIVISTKDFEKFSIVMEKHGFRKTISKLLENIYSSEFARFEKETELSVNVDVLVGGIGIRQTGGAISFDKIRNNSFTAKVQGMEKEVLVRIPKKELLIAMKLQAGRLTDLRDAAALCHSFDVEAVREFLRGADTKTVKTHVQKLLSVLDDKGFLDSFKGVFAEKGKGINVSEIKKLGRLLE